MRYTPYASPTGFSSPLMRSGSDGDSAQYCGSDGLVDIPKSSSALMLSSPILATPPDLSPSNPGTVADTRIYASFPEENDSSVPYDELEQWFASQADNAGCLSGESQSSDHGACDLEDVDSDDGDYDDLYPRSLDTHEAQMKFSERLTKLLLHVAKEENDHKTQPAEQSSKPSPTRSTSAIHAPTHVLTALNSASASLYTTCVSSSVYSADISGFETGASVSAPSWSVSASSRASKSCTSSFSSVSGPDYDLQAPNRSFAQYASSHASSKDESAACLPGAVPNFNPQLTVLSLTGAHAPLRTPSLCSHSLSRTPAAPKKVQHHIRIPSENAIIKSKKRRRSNSPPPTADETPTHNCLMDQDAPSPETGEHTRDECTEQVADENVPPEPLKRRADTLVKRRKLTIPSTRVHPKELADVDSTYGKQELRASTLASFRRAASMRSEVEVANVLTRVSRCTAHMMGSINVNLLLLTCSVSRLKKGPPPTLSHSRLSLHPPPMCSIPAPAFLNTSANQALSSPQSLLHRAFRPVQPHPSNGLATIT